MTGLEPLQHRQVLVQRVDLAADRARPFDHAVAEFGGHRAPPVTDQELHAELGFELADVLGDVRLHRPQAVGGRGEAAFFGHREQGVELAYVHGLAPVPSRFRVALAGPGAISSTD